MKIIRPKYKMGDTRVITKFTLFPITIDNETRWLEKVTIKQRVCPAFSNLIPYPPQILIDKGYCHFAEWKNIEFL